MDFYTNAQETEYAAKVLFDAGVYRQAIYMCCLAVELYLKSKLHLVPHSDHLETSHDVVGQYKAIIKRYPPKSDLSFEIDRCRKYFNESRYPYAGDARVYTKEFADEFLHCVAAVKDFIDNKCIATVDDLKNKYNSDHNT